MSLRWKTILGIALIEGVLLLLLVYTAMSYLRSSNYEGLLKRAQTTASLFSTTAKDAVLSYDLASLEVFAEELLSNPDIRYARILGTGEALFAAAGTAELLARPFVADQLPEQVDDGIFDIQANIVEGGELYGRVQIGIDMRPLEQAITDTQNWSITIASIEMGLVALFSFVLGTYLTAQLTALRLAAREVEQDNLDTEVPVKGRDEVAEVGTAFNAMIHRLRTTQRMREQYEAELKELNQSLEDRVEQRTQALLLANEELTAANRQIQATQAQLLQSEKMASLGQMAAGVAHEINNPVGFVMSNINSLRDYVQRYQQLEIELSRLLDQPPGSDAWAAQQRSLTRFLEEQEFGFIRDDIDELITDVIEGSQRIRDIVQGLKEFSHIDQAALQLTDINQCIETTLKIVNNELKYHCDIRKDLQPLPRTLCNPGQLNQVFMNLLLNAGQALGEEGGVIGVRTRSLGAFIEIRVFDNGTGIAEEHIDKLFDPFFTTKRVGEGTGLGLAITYGLIQEHKGSIEVKSKPGVGTSFIIRLPVHNDRAQFSQSGDSAAKAG